MQIGPYRLRNRLAVAPMAGVTDRPFRQLCRRLGAGYAVSEMTTSDARLWNTAKSRRRRAHDGEPEPVAVQIAGTDPEQMAEAARFNVEQGAQIIDINMGCPARKVCNVLAGSALMRDESLAARILERVVQSVAVPVTLKMRTGWNRDCRNAGRIAHIAEEAGISALTIHGRTRADFYDGHAEYETIAAVKSAVRIPVIANGDIDSPAKARQVLESTGADALMIGRAAQGRPWIFSEIDASLEQGRVAAGPSPEEIHAIIVEHLEALYSLYGAVAGCRVARKHIGWYSRSLAGGDALRRSMNQLEDPVAQLSTVDTFFNQQTTLAGKSWPTDQRAA
ncbi:MAG: tRNA dihydrouridine synthase DusB [Betaproteobacteria bacterium]|nr:tRNA dihydrouridine synthase DusB [Betaproteobacteria bacterium]